MILTRQSHIIDKNSLFSIVESFELERLMASENEIKEVHEDPSIGDDDSYRITQNKKQVSITL